LAQRFISVEKPREAQKAALLSGFLYLLYPIVIFVPAWAAPFLLPDQFDQTTMMPIAGFDLDQAYILVTQKILAGLAPGLIGLLVCSMFAATMSMIDSDINSLAAVFTKDIWQRNVNRNISDEGLFRVGRMATAAFGLAVIVAAVIVSMSPGMNKVFSFTVKLLGGLLSPIAIPLMFGMIYKKATTRGAILSFCGGMLTYLIATLVYDVAAFEVYAGLEILVCVVIYFGESLIGSRSQEKEEEVDTLFEKLASSRTE
jgi:Na+/proline symporter